MIQIWYLLKGFLVGFSIALPVGPIGALCIRRTMHYGRLSGFMSGLGAALADAFFAGVAGFGLTIIADIVSLLHTWLRIGGGLFLIYMGIHSMRAAPLPRAGASVHSNPLSDCVSTFFLTLGNPITILAFMAFFSGLGMLDSGPSSVALLIMGVFLGSLAWWMFLAEGITFVRRWLADEAIGIVSRITGFGIMLFGVVTLLSALVDWVRA